MSKHLFSHLNQKESLIPMGEHHIPDLVVAVVFLFMFSQSVKKESKSKPCHWYADNRKNTSRIFKYLEVAF